jgi:aerobic carbon-monoxide dehydrogenase large subunit
VSEGRNPPLVEAERLIHDGGRYTDDIPQGRCLHAAFVRSDIAHGVIAAIDLSGAREIEGVTGVFVQSDLDEMGAGPVQVGWSIPGQRQTEYDLLARDRVRYVGEMVAVVLAENRYLAEDAASRVSVTYEPLPAVADLEAAMATDAGLLYPEWGDNVLARHRYEGGDADARFDEAPVVLSARFSIGRAIPFPMEPRGARIRFDHSRGSMEVVGSFQSAHHCQAQLAEALGCSLDTVRVIPPDVGGSFGVKDHMPLEVGAIAVLSRALGCDTTWIEDRAENLVSAPHSRGQLYQIEVAADADGRMLALRGLLWFDAGAGSGAHGIGTALYSGSMLPGPYDIADYHLDVIGVVTNKVPSAAYRGYGGPEASFVMEGMVDRLARRIGVEPLEVRRRNLIPVSRFPYRNAAGLTYDVADYGRALDAALKLADTGDLGEPNASTVRGVGVACVVQRGGFGPSQLAVDAGMTFGGFETVAVRMDATGHASVFTGISSQGQGITTALAQICSERLGISLTDVTVVSGDTAITPYSPVGAIASRGVAVGGSAAYKAASVLADRLRGSAALILEARAADIELIGGQARVRGSGGAGVDLSVVAASLQRGKNVPAGMDPGLEVVATHEPTDETCSYGAHVAVVTVDRETGRVAVERYACVTDCGVMINPGVVEGQIVGAIVQGIGGALYEQVDYDASGAPLFATSLDYRMPTAADVPSIRAGFIETATPLTLTGARGAGEIAINGPAAAIANAVADALGPDAEFPSQIPMIPERIWALIQSNQ